MALDDLEKKLYTKGQSDESEVSAKKPPREVPAVSGEWKDEPVGQEEFIMQSRVEHVFDALEKYNLKNLFKWTAIIGGLVVLGASAFLSYQFFNYSGIRISSKAPDKIMIGVPFDFTVVYSNNSPTILGGATLSVSLPEQFAFVGEDQSKRTMSDDIGLIGLGTTGEKTFRLVALSGEQSLRSIPVTLSYGTAGLGTRFDKTIGQDVYVGDSALSLDFTAANKVLANETFEIHANYKNISNNDAKGLELKMDYPENFNFISSSLPADFGDDTWKLGDLRPGVSNDFVLKGSVNASADSFFDIGASISTTIDGKKYTIAVKSASVAISAPPLSVTVQLNNSSDYVAKLTDNLSYTISYANNSDVGFRDVVLKIKLSGEMFDFTTLNPNDIFNSLTNTLTWNASLVPDFKTLDPGKSGTINFRIFTKKDYPIARLSDKNFVLKATAEIESPTVPSYVAASRSVGVATLLSKVTGQTVVASKGLFRDPNSGIVNKGHVPLHVDQPTQYTIHWIVRNFSTDVTDVNMSAFLKPNVKATGVIKSNIDILPVYNERTSELTWDIPKIIATKGVISTPIEGIIQVEVTPGINQVGANVPLIGNTTLSAFDTFTNSKLQYLSLGFDTGLDGNDPTLTNDDHSVLP